MKLDTFFDNFGLLADTPNGVQKLREMVLQLAVQGKLIPQDSTDEPASVLLEKINAEKERLVKEKKIKKGKPLPPINSEQIPYEIPDSWEWVRLRTVCHDLDQKKPDKKFTYIDVTSIDKEKGVVTDGVKLLEAEEAPSRARKIVEKGTVIYSTVRPYLLNIAIIDHHFDPEPIVSTAFAVLNPFRGIYNRYVYYYLRSKPFIEYVEDAMTGMAYPAINDSKMNIGLIPIPPTNEQERIVSKVDELMAICDELKARKQQVGINCIQLNDASIDKLLTTREPKKFIKHWQRICDNFDILYSKPENVSKLRQAILQLAVQGKLVPQDPKDEPASVLLEKSRNEKKRLIKNNKLKKGALPASMANDEILYKLPEGWAWARLPEVVAHEENAIKRGPFGSAIRKAYFVPEGYKVYEQKNAIYNDFELGDYYINEEKFNELRGFEVKPNDIIISCSGTIGKLAIAPKNMQKGVINQALLKLSLNSRIIINEFFLVLFPAFFMKTDTLSDLKGTAMKNIVSVQMLKNLPFPLPSFEEQKRIVAKVDELMALCDKLETSLSQSQTNCDMLIETVVAEILAA